MLLLYSILAIFPNFASNLSKANKKTAKSNLQKNTQNV